MGVISRLPQGGGGGGFIFNITTTESSLFGQDIIITGAEPTKTVTFSADGKATAKAKKAGTYTFTCGGAVYSQEYQLYGEYPVELNLYDAVITVTGKVQLAKPMDSRYIVPDGYYKPNNVDGMQVSLYDGASQIAIPQAFSGGGDTVTFTVDTREHTNVTVKFSDEGAKGFTNPADVPLTLEKGVPASASGTWVEKYAELEVQKMDAELLPFDVILKWGETANEQITWTTDNVSDKSQFIVKKYTDYTIECGDITDTINTITQEALINHETIPYTFSTKLLIFDKGKWGNGFSKESLSVNLSTTSLNVNDGKIVYSTANVSNQNHWIYALAKVTDYSKFHIKCKLINNGGLLDNPSVAFSGAVVSNGILYHLIPSTPHSKRIEPSQYGTQIEVDINDIKDEVGEKYCGLALYCNVSGGFQVEIYEMWLEP